MGALIEAGSDPLDVNKNNVISALDTISHYHCRHRAENHHGNQICDEHARFLPLFSLFSGVFGACPLSSL